MSDDQTGDKFVFGNTMKSTAGRIYARGSFGKIENESSGAESLFRVVTPFASTPLPGSVEYLELLIFGEAIAEVRAMTKEELLALEQDDLYYLSTMPELDAVLGLIEKQLKPINRVIQAMKEGKSGDELLRACKASMEVRNSDFQTIIEKCKAEMLEDTDPRDIASVETLKAIRGIPLEDWQKEMTGDVNDYLHPTEPALQGDTSIGLSKAWIDWYMKTHNAPLWRTLREGKARLRRIKAVPKRPKRTPNPK